MKYVFRTVSIAAALGLALALLMPSSPPPARAAGVKRVVDNDTDPTPCKGKTDNTIMEAVAAVGINPGTITVCPGTYAEKVVLAGAYNVKLIGKPGARIIPPDSPSPYSGAIVDVEDSEKVTVQGFIIDGAGRFSDLGANVGILYNEAGGTVTRNYISNIHATPPGSSCMATGIRVTTARGTMKIFRNTVYDFGCQAISVEDSPKVSVQKNLLWATMTYGATPTGIALSTSPGSSITSNSISTDWRLGLTVYPNGIRLSESSNVKISGNQINHFWFGILVLASNREQNADKLTISANRINDVRTGISIQVSSVAASLGAPSSNNDKITGNTFYAPTYAGNYPIWLNTTIDGGTFTPSLTNTTISGNKQYGFALYGGRLVRDDSGGVTIYSSSNKTIPPPTGS